jgi:RNA-directed DNA polymerase
VGAGSNSHGIDESNYGGPHVSPRWFKLKYFDRRGNRDWSFFGDTCADEGRLTKVWLYHARSTPITRHVKVKGEANPYDPTSETYFEERVTCGSASRQEIKH